MHLLDISNRNDLAFSGIAYLAQRYRGTPSLAQVQLLHLVQLRVSVGRLYLCTYVNAGVH